MWTVRRHLAAAADLFHRRNTDPADGVIPLGRTLGPGETDSLLVQAADPNIPAQFEMRMNYETIERTYTEREGRPGPPRFEINVPPVPTRVATDSIP